MKGEHDDVHDDNDDADDVHDDDDNDNDVHNDDDSFRSSQAIGR